MELKDNRKSSKEDETLMIDIQIGVDVVTINVDGIISRLINKKDFKQEQESQLAEIEVIALCDNSKELFKQDAMLLELNAPIVVFGDIHGHFKDLMKFFSMVDYPGMTNFLFLGGYVNRGPHSLETLCLLLCYKIKYPQTFFMLRGNHESENLTRAYGFFEDCKKWYNTRVWKTFLDMFNYLPIAALIGRKIFCVHGGLGHDLHNFDQIRKLSRPLESIDVGLACDLLWADPCNLGWNTNERGCSYTFGSDVVTKFAAKHELDLIVRGNQPKLEGFEFFAKKQLMTIFSAANYCGHDNAAAILSIGEGLVCHIKVLKSKLMSDAKTKLQ